MKYRHHSVSSGSSRILAGDIGATHSRLAIFSHGADYFELLRSETYLSLEHAGLPEVLARFLESDREEVDAVCLGLPAPIHSGVVLPLPNLSWQIDQRQLFQTVGTDRILLINDVQASAAGIPGLSESDLVSLQPGLADPAGNRVVVSVGTGFGVSALTASDHTIATEAGHCTFAPLCDFDIELQTRLRAQFGHVSWERVASGAALPYVHALLSSEGSPLLESSEIVRRAESDNSCAQALEILRRYLGTAAGNAALTLMASGGLYLTGGVASRILDESTADQFLTAFHDKGRMRNLLERMPIFLVRTHNLALRGAAQAAVNLLDRG